MGWVFARGARAAAAGLLLALSAMGWSAHPGWTQAGEPSLTIELNSLQPSDRGCRFTFVATNALGGELSSVAFELVLFNNDGMVSRITVVDFKDLPQGKTKVRQFDFSGVVCSDLGRVLVNDATECSGDGIEPKACLRHLKTQSRVETLFGI